MTNSLKNTHRYDDIIHLPHPVSTVHPPMSRQNRAAQFSPFSALTGYEAAVQETSRLTDRKILLDEDQKTALDGKLQLLQERLCEHPRITVTYFIPDEKKDGGTYASVSGTVKKIDEASRMVIFQDGSRIPIDEIYSLAGAFWDGD